MCVVARREHYGTITFPSAEDLHQVLEAWWREIPFELSVKARLGDVEGALQAWHGDRLFQVLVES